MGADCRGRDCKGWEFISPGVGIHESGVGIHESGMGIHESGDGDS